MGTYLGLYTRGVPKLHAYAHLPLDVWRFGPVREEWCFASEAWHGVVKEWVRTSNYRNLGLSNLRSYLHRISFLLSDTARQLHDAPPAVPLLANEGKRGHDVKVNRLLRLGDYRFALVVKEVDRQEGRIVRVRGDKVPLVWHGGCGCAYGSMSLTVGREEHSYETVASLPAAAYMYVPKGQRDTFFVADFCNSLTDFRKH